MRLAAKLTGWKIDIRTPEGKEVPLEEEKDETEDIAKEEEKD